ncbi:AMP-binding protein, partial [Candidatus Omnitrophota bacterium]
MNTIDGSFRESAKKYPEHIALRYYQDETWEHIPYIELQSAVHTVAHGLADMGIGNKTKVALMGENRPEWIVSYLAIITCGAVAVPIDAALGEIETMHILRHSGAETVLCSMPCYEVIGRVLSDTESLHNIIIFDRNITVRHEHKGEGEGRDVVNRNRKKNGHKNFLSYDELRDKGTLLLSRGGLTFPEKDVADLASIIYTSGTTGTAKGVMLTHKNIMS